MVAQDYRDNVFPQCQCTEGRRIVLVTIIGIHGTVLNFETSELAFVILWVDEGELPIVVHQTGCALPPVKDPVAAARFQSIGEERAVSIGDSDFVNKETGELGCPVRCYQ
jgi:hypothetical protein